MKIGNWKWYFMCRRCHKSHNYSLQYYTQWEMARRRVLTREASPRIFAMLYENKILWQTLLWICSRCTPSTRLNARFSWYLMNALHSPMSLHCNPEQPAHIRYWCKTPSMSKRLAIADGKEAPGNMARPEDQNNTKSIWEKRNQEDPGAPWYNKVTRELYKEVTIF